MKLKAFIYISCLRLKLFMKKIDYQILRRYFSQESGGKEKQQVIRWFLEDKHNDALKTAVGRQWHESEHDDKWKEYDLEEIRPILDKVHHKMNIIEYERQNRNLPGKILKQLRRIAAILFLPLLLTAGWYMMKSSAINNRTGYAEMIAPRGARIHFDLPDGSRGWLNSESTLKYPMAFAGKKREVELSGEGYFEVVKDERRPFIVKTGKLDVVALGTKFDVNAYPDDEIVEVTLQAGRVVVSAIMPGQKKSSHLTELVPGEKVQIRKGDYSVKKTKVEDVECYTAWKDGQLIFRNDPMDEVVKKLGRWYNVEFYLQGEKLKDYHYHATFEYESLDEVLKLIRLTSPVNYRILERKKLPDGSFSKTRITFSIKKGVKLK